jgi:hypothetical protein
MALITSAATGNFSAGATWTGGVVPTVGDEARASTGHTITIDVDTTCDEVSNAGTGIFTLASGVTLTANVTSKSTTTSRNCLQFTAASPATASIVGNVTGGTVAGAVGAANTSSGILSITGNLTAGSGSSSYAVNNTSTGVLNITGNCTAGSGGSASAVFNTFGGSVNITGNLTGGSANTATGLLNNSNGVVTITGNITGGSAGTSHGLQNASGVTTITGNVTGGVTGVGLVNNGSATVSITGICSGGTGANGVNNTSTGLILAKKSKGNQFGPGNSASPVAAAVGISNTSLGVIEIEELEYGDYGMSPTSGTGIRLKKVSTNAAVFNYCDTAGAKTLVDATQGQMPAATDVRDGVSYASGALTGSCKVPAAASVGFGVPVDATTGTAALTPASVWEYATRTLTAGGGISAEDVWTYATREITGGTVDTLVNAPTVPTAEEIATEVWDTPTSGLTTSGAIGTRLKNSSTVATTGSQLAAALS